MAAPGAEELRAGGPGPALGPAVPPHPGVSRRRGRTLLVRHLPAELTAAEKEDLLQHFGAVSVRVLSDHGRLKHTAFATFPSENAAAKALSRLHQLKLLGHTLVVEFAKEQESSQVLSQPSVSDKCKSLEEPVKEEEKTEPSCIKIENGIAPNHGLTFPINSCLKYLYPPPSSAILANIANALASVPKFYVQVLHLMNKMNLPPPFGPITARPPMYEEYLPVPVPPPPIPPLPPEEPPLPEEEEERLSSGDESEYESDNDEEKERMTKLMELATLQPKRPINTKKRGVRKKQRIKDMLNVPVCTSHSNSHPTLSPSDVFEQPQHVGHKKIEFHISTEIPAVLQINSEKEEKTDLYATTEEINNTGFGRIFPAPSSNDKMETEEEDDEIPSEFISRKDLEKNRLSREEMEKYSVFRNYEPGDPNCRIYVKNLAKQVQEKDLKFIFGRYVDFQSEVERNMFDIRLMKEGRMKGQAFIGLPNEKAAAKALKEANGYVLFEKPMVVQFARSARPKQDANEGKRKK
ncbi:RNA-binding region-containing protein 3 [Oenanthe melanoleuca]|uniref:RNA-binding region-containing protein 3 n=1 Tax=Oenanthe melanoleuca TaxID=2939378 RepID=UPI0024C16213|nr:RNA-binding region-containing protein 3 [Oenanthe melanoleuca]XP_056353792.1 RNA-binding region-containing protein 3 [Oenanthe melanoleuca]